MEVLAATQTLLYNFVNCRGGLFTFILLKAAQPKSEKLPSIYTEREAASVLNLIEVL